MADGKEEREERKARVEEEANHIHPGDGHNDEPVYEGQPERGGS